jgi:hypothetical protein
VNSSVGFADPNEVPSFLAEQMDKKGTMYHLLIAGKHELLVCEQCLA